MSAAAKKFVSGLASDEREALWLNRYSEADHVAEQFGLSVAEVRSICRTLDKAEGISGFLTLKAWHNAVLIDDRLSAVEKVASLRVWSFVNVAHLYAWPSQDRLAKELGYSRGPNLGKALRRSFEIGAYSPVRIKNLPIELCEIATKISRRSRRGVAYRLNPVDRWEEEAVTFNAEPPSDMFRDGTFECSVGHHPNIELNNQPAAPDSTHSGVRDSSSASRVVEPSQYGNDRGRNYG